MATTLAAAEPPVPFKTWIAVVGSILGAFMAVLNIQVTASSLPDIEGGIGTGGVNGTWISTAYLIGEIIVVPMTDFLSRVFSLRRYMIANTAIFLALSVACGQAHSLPEMIVLRALQGFAGGVLIPLAFTIIVSMLPPSKRALGLAGYAVTATFAPAIGPTIGGWLTDTYRWQTIFYMNLVPGALMLGALIYALPRSKAQPGLLQHGDWFGIALMAVGLACFQTVLDDGNTFDWFGSPFIVRLSVVAAVTLVGFLVWELRCAEPLLELRLLARRNFGLGTLGNFLLGFALCGSAYLLPQYLAVSQGLDCRAERQGGGLDRPAATADHPLRAVADAPVRSPPAGLCRLRRLRGELHDGPASEQRFCRATTAAAGCRAGDGAGAGDDPAFCDRHGRNQQGAGRCGVGVVQYAAQPGRRHRHRSGRDLPDQAGAVPLLHHQRPRVADAAGDTDAHRLDAALFPDPWDRRSGRRHASGSHRHRQQYSRAGHDHGLCRLLRTARRLSDLRRRAGAAAKEGQRIGRRRALGLSSENIHR